MPPKQKQPYKANPFVVICAYNEAGYIGHAIDEVVKTGLVPAKNIIVVNDGSTDKTSQIARGKGCTVLDLAKNWGKASAFFVGMNKALRSGATSVVTLDADLLRLPKNNLKAMIKPAEEATRKNGISMVLANPLEKNSPVHFLQSGTRAYSKAAMQELYKFRSGGHLKIPLRHGLETFLNAFFKEEEWHCVPTRLNGPKTIYSGAYREGKMPNIAQEHEYYLAAHWLEDGGVSEIIKCRGKNYLSEKKNGWWMSPHGSHEDCLRDWLKTETMSRYNGGHHKLVKRWTDKREWERLKTEQPWLKGSYASHLRRIKKMPPTPHW